MKIAVPHTYPDGVFPVLALGLAALWGGSVWMGIAVIILAAGHIPISWNSYKSST